PPGGKSLFTGYYEPVLRGSLTREGPYQFPLYAPPADLVAQPDTPATGQPGKTAWGRMQGGQFAPHVSRAEITSGALEGKNLELLFVDDEVDLFFLHIQGSGQIQLPDGAVKRVGFAGKNGLPYTAIGAVLKSEGGLETVTMQSIKAYLRAHPEKRQEILNRNASYVFFQFLETDAPLGASGQKLMPERSLAVDDTLWPYGTEAIVETRDPLHPEKPFIRRMIMADTGGAIRGLVRGDIYFGSGEEAGLRAGCMNHPGTLWIILPRG
ncbi:MAG TPA: MltA domain-containing protein, partial [Alphaproteobacteria bacterium]|nr:MltA domain-containing protein [Alphaproteobacteria bacterium]